MRIRLIGYFFLLVVPWRFACAQSALPTFQYTVKQSSYTLVGRDPAHGGVTTIPTVIVPITLSLEAKRTAGKPFIMDAAPDIPSILRSPVFSKFAFPSGGTTQYADALLRSTFPHADGWHTLLAKPEVKAVRITVPVGYGYVLTSKSSGRSVAVVDVDFLRKEVFQQIPKQEGKLVVAVAHNTTYYADGDATVCCSWGTHGIDPATGNSFVLASYLRAAPAVVEDADVQPLTQQLGEFINDPLHNPQLYGYNIQGPGNNFPAGWMRPTALPAEGRAGCGGRGVASDYFLLEPTNTNPKNHFPSSKAFTARQRGTTYHLQNVALLPWYVGGGSEGLGSTYSFPDSDTLAQPAQPCPARVRHSGAGGPAPTPTVAPVPLTGPPNGHHLIGYWGGRNARQISPQWDIVIVAFATPDPSAPEGSLRFQPPAEPSQFKADIAWLKGQGRKVMISLGGGGVTFNLTSAQSVPAFVSSVSSIVSDYGFDGVDIDFETPSLTLDPGDSDFRNPTTPSMVHLISALRQLRDHFGPQFMISLVPEGTQVPSGFPGYGGQFGSYLPIAFALRGIFLSSMCRITTRRRSKVWMARSISPVPWTITPP